jgi:hypothetical protein
LFARVYAYMCGGCGGGGGGGVVVVVAVAAAAPAWCVHAWDLLCVHATRCWCHVISELVCRWRGYAARHCCCCNGAGSVLSDSRMVGTTALLLLPSSRVRICGVLTRAVSSCFSAIAEVTRQMGGLEDAIAVTQVHLFSCCGFFWETIICLKRIAP